MSQKLTKCPKCFRFEDAPLLLNLQVRNWFANRNIDETRSRVSLTLDF